MGGRTLWQCCVTLEGWWFGGMLWGGWGRIEGIHGGVWRHGMRVHRLSQFKRRGRMYCEDGGCTSRANSLSVLSSIPVQLQYPTAHIRVPYLPLLYSVQYYLTSPLLLFSSPPPSPSRLHTLSYILNLTLSVLIWYPSTCTLSCISPDINPQSKYQSQSPYIQNPNRTRRSPPKRKRSTTIGPRAVSGGGYQT